MTTVIAHVTDTHFGGPADARARAERVLAHLLALDPRPDVLLVTGDVADHGTPEEYAEARAVLDAWPGPSSSAPATTTCARSSPAGCSTARPTAPILLGLEAADFRLLMLDSLVSAQDGRRIDHGELGPDQLDWLDRQLASDDKPTSSACTTRRVDIGLGLMAPILLKDPEPLELVIMKHPHVVATLVGHAHTACATTFAGRPLLIGGGCASTVPLDAEDLPVVWEARAAQLRAPPAPRRRPADHPLEGALDAAHLRHRHAAGHRGPPRRRRRRARAGLRAAAPARRAARAADRPGARARPASCARTSPRSASASGPGPFTGLRVGLVTARTLGYVLELPVYGVCTLDVLAVEAVDTRTVAGEFVVATDARRREVYFATYDETGARLDGPEVGKPADLATELAGGGGGRRPLPGGVPAPGRAGAAQRRLAGPGDRRRARRAARPRAALPAPARRGDARDAQEGLVKVRPATEADTDAIAASEADNLGADAWSDGLVAEGVAGRLPTVHYLVAESDGALVGHAVASLVAEIAELQRIAVAAPWRRRGVAAAPARRGGRPGRRQRRRAGAAGGPRGQRRGARLLRRPRLRRGGPAAAATTATARPRSCWSAL